MEIGTNSVRTGGDRNELCEDGRTGGDRNELREDGWR